MTTESLLMTFPLPHGVVVEMHDAGPYLAQWGMTPQFADAIAVVCTTHNQAIQVRNENVNGSDLPSTYARNPGTFCVACKALFAVLPAPLPSPVPASPQPYVPELQPVVQPEPEPPEAEAESVVERLESEEPPAPEEASEAPKVPKAPKVEKAEKPVPPKDVIRSVLGQWRIAKATVEAIEKQLEAAKDAAAEALAPLQHYAASWEHEGKWYVFAQPKGGVGRPMLRVQDKKPGRPPKEGS